MSSGSNIPVIIRRGTTEDIEPILNLLTEYELPQSYFEPFYLNDTNYRPEHSWVVEQNGRLVSHLRIYDRWIRIGRAKLHIAGIGNVITARDARGQGYAGKLMLAILPELSQEGYDYSGPICLAYIAATDGYQLNKTSCEPSYLPRFLDL
jgi:GNAT superfamily N-acetyltransferase